FMVLHAAYTTLLTRHGAGTDIPIGTPIAGRTDNNLDHLIGFFVNTLIIRTTTTNNPTFTQLIHQTRHTTLHAYQHQDLPLQHLPLFQAMLALTNNASADLGLPGLTVTEEPVDVGSAKFDLVLALTEHSRGISGSLEYSLDLFDPHTAEMIAKRFGHLLE